MLKELFGFVLNNYINEYKKAEKSDPNYNVLMQQIPAALNALFPMRKDLLISGSCGIGQKTDYPWVAIFNRNLTTTAQRGLYMVYLFKKDMSGFYLSLHQGITYFEKRFKRKRYQYARKVADYFRSEIGDEYFDRGEIDLLASSASLGRGYQETNILSKYYAKDSFTSEEIEKDLLKMLAIYDELVGVLGEDNYDYNNAINKIVFDVQDAFEDAVSGIDNIKKAISSPKDVNVIRTLRYIEPQEKRTKKYSKIRSTGSVRKIDYIEKAKTDAEVGLLGEMLALSYERERLIREGHSDLADKVRHVASVSDAFGYDIISYQLIGLEMKEVYIEVKTTTNKLDVDFPVSKNEVLTSNEKKDRYCIFRIYDAKSVTPLFYKVFGKIEEHFELDPVSYMARYVGKRQTIKQIPL
ncbi:MAG: MrcB family domain-containing protein [Bacilli bacterium]